MRFQEYNLDKNLRICSYIIDNENLEFHKHQYLSDITFCVYGKLLLELPKLKECVIINPGEIIPVPKNEWHRVISHSGEESKYILIQKGRFDIEFNELLVQDIKEDYNIQHLSKYRGINSDIEYIKQVVNKYTFFNDDDKKDITEAIHALCNIKA